MPSIHPTLAHSFARDGVSQTEPCPTRSPGGEESLPSNKVWRAIDAAAPETSLFLCCCGSQSSAVLRCTVNPECGWR